MSKALTYEDELEKRYGVLTTPHRGKKHISHCFCTDCCEARDAGCSEDAHDYDEWRKAFPDLDWKEGPT